jgi:hypothetical protein
MTMAVEKTLAIGYLLLALRTAKTIKAFKQPSTCINDDPSSAEYEPLPHKKQRGRPPSQSTLRIQALMASRPVYAKPQDPGQSELLNALKNYWEVLRENQGLHSKTISDAFALEVIAMDEEQFEAKISGHSLSVERQAVHAKILEELEDKRIAVIGNARRSGQKVSAKTQRSQIETEAPGLLEELAAKGITPETVQTRLRKLPVKVPIPTVRSLRRIAQQKRGQEPVPK